VIGRACSACEEVKNAHAVLFPSGSDDGTLHLILTQFRYSSHLHVFQKQNIIFVSKLNLFSSLDVRVGGSRDCNSIYPSDTAEELRPSSLNGGQE